MASIAKGTFHLFISDAIFFLTGYIIYIALARYLFTPEQFGVYGVVIGFASVLNMILTGGIQQTISKFVSQDTKLAGIVKREALRISLAFSIALYIILYFSSPYIALFFNDPSLTILIQLASAIVLIQPTYSIFVGYFNGLRKFSAQALVKSVYLVAKLGMILGLVLLGFGVFGAVAGFISAYIIALAFLFIFIYPKAEKIAGKIESALKFEPKNMLYFALPLFAFAILTNLLMNIDLFLVKALSPILIANTLSGYYTAALTLAHLPQTMMVTFATVIFPLISASTYAKNKLQTRYYINSAMRYTLLILLPIVLLLASTSKEAITLLYSSAYAQGSLPLFILSFGLAFYALFMILTTIIVSSGRPARAMLLVFAMLIISIALSYYLIPLYSITGAAAASTIAMATGFLVSAAYVLYKFKALFPAKPSAKIILASVIIYALSLAFYAEGFLLIAKYIALLLLYCGMLFAMREIGKKEFKLMASIVR